MVNSIVASDLRQGCAKFPARFVVPIYQRVFTWGAKEVGRLLVDLHEHFVVNKKKEPYYLGVVTVVADDNDVNHPDYLLVDGQQRLTCVMLLGALLGWGLDFDKLEYEDRPKDQKAKGKIREYAASGQDWSDECDFGNEAMNAFFKCAFEHRDIVETLKNRKDIPSLLRLFVSELPSNPYQTDPAEQNKYFEKMNSGGRQLEPHEILKVKICSKSTLANAFEDWNRAIDFSEACHDAASGADGDGTEMSFDDVIFGGVMPKPDERLADYEEEYLPGRSGLLDQPMFLLHVRALVENNGSLDPHWREDKLLESFPMEIDEDWANLFVRTMVEYRSFLDEKIIHLSFDTAKNAYDYMFEDDELSNDQGVSGIDKEKVRQFQSMLYVAAQGRQGRQEWLLSAFKAFGGVDIDYADILSKLKEIDRTLSSKDGNVFSESYVDELCYSDQRRWLFWRLDYLLWERVIEECALFPSGGVDEGVWNGQLTPQEMRTVKQYRFHTGRSIEHLHPQTDDGNTDWNAPVGKLLGTSKDQTEKTKKDMFYNLCLITPSLNSTLGNDSVAVKLAKIKDLTKSARSGLQSVKMLFMYKECCGTDSRWTPEIALLHLKRMKKVLASSYLN